MDPNQTTVNEDFRYIHGQIDSTITLKLIKCIENVGPSYGISEQEDAKAENTFEFTCIHKEGDVCKIIYAGFLQ